MKTQDSRKTCWHGTREARRIWQPQRQRRRQRQQRRRQRSSGAKQLRRQRSQLLRHTMMKPEPNWTGSDSDSDMWPTNPGRYRPSVHKQRWRHTCMQHTVKNNALEEQESSHPVTEHPIDVQAFRSAICTYWNCGRTQENIPSVCRMGIL
jgi:hypothetical protein